MSSVRRLAALLALLSTTAANAELLEVRQVVSGMA
jgi:hypothetical protein